MKDLLGDIQIFSGLSGDELTAVRSFMREKYFDSGETLFHENQKGNELFIVQEGIIGITVKLPDGMDLEISSMEAGNFFGEMSIFEDAPRSATCTAKTQARLLSLHKKDFFKLMDSHPAAAADMMYRMLTITAERLNNTGKFLSDMVQWGEQARKRSITDDFTGLYNRRFLEDALTEQLSLAKVRKSNLSVAMVDLDHFGTLNKEYGEKKGDEVILAAVGVFNSLFSGDDILIRYGGDEFTFILPGLCGGEALEKCEQVCSEIRALTMLENMTGSIRRLTSSIGVSAFPEHAATPEGLLDTADKALYKAKEGGRNKAALAD